MKGSFRSRSSSSYRCGNCVANVTNTQVVTERRDKSSTLYYVCAFWYVIYHT